MPKPDRGALARARREVAEANELRVKAELSLLRYYEDSLRVITENKRLRTENARLREALSAIAETRVDERVDYEIGSGGPVTASKTVRPLWSHEQAMVIARAALESSNQI